MCVWIAVRANGTRQIVHCEAKAHKLERNAKVVRVEFKPCRTWLEEAKESL